MKCTPPPHEKLLCENFIQYKVHPPPVKFPPDSSILAENSPPCKITPGRFQTIPRNVSRREISQGECKKIKKKS